MLAEYGEGSDIDASFTDGVFYVTLYADAHKFNWEMKSISNFTKLLNLIQAGGYLVPKQIYIEILSACERELEQIGSSKAN